MGRRRPPVPDEEVELDFAMRARVEELHGRLRTTSHYELLGVDRDADKKTIKRLYFQRTVEFHTDRYFGKKLGRYGSMMNAIFCRMNDAYDVLASPERRAAYDAQLRERAARHSLVDALLAEAEEEIRAEADAGREHIELTEAVRIRGDAVREEEHPTVPPEPAREVRRISGIQSLGSMFDEDDETDPAADGTLPG